MAEVTCVGGSLTLSSSDPNNVMDMIYLMKTYLSCIAYSTELMDEPKTIEDLSKVGDLYTGVSDFIGNGRYEYAGNIEYLSHDLGVFINDGGNQDDQKTLDRLRKSDLHLVFDYTEDHYGDPTLTNCKISFDFKDYKHTVKTIEEIEELSYEDYFDRFGCEGCYAMVDYCIEEIYDTYESKIQGSKDEFVTFILDQASNPNDQDIYDDIDEMFEENNLGSLSTMIRQFNNR